MLHANCMPMILNFTHPTYSTSVNLHRIFVKLLSVYLPEANVAITFCRQLVFPILPERIPMTRSIDHTYTLTNSCTSHVNLICDLGVMLDSGLKCDKLVYLIAREAVLRSRLILDSFHSCVLLLLVEAFLRVCIRCLDIVVLFGLLIIIT